MKDTGHIYVLMLEDNKWYVGFTRDIKKRMKSHFTNIGSNYTKKHKPIAITKIIAGHKRLEKPITLKLMRKKGMLNVRGSKWSQPTMRLRHKRQIKKEYERLGQ